MAETAFEKWASAYRTLAAEVSWPSETMVRLFKGDYIPGLDKDYAGKKVLDIGFGSGNNLIFLASLGFQLFGTEVHPEICDSVSGMLRRLGYESDLRVGTNRQIPFHDNEFDFLVSWDVIHYEDNEDAMCNAISEYARVLRPGGRLILSTAGPEHKILSGSRTLGGHRYQIGRKGDFREGQVFFYFDAPNYVQHYFCESFRDLLVGRIRDFLFTETLDTFIVTGVKG